MRDGQYELYNTVIVKADDLTDKIIIINTIDLTIDEENITADLLYNVSIGTSLDSLEKVIISLNEESITLTAEEYLKLDEDIIIRLNDFFILENHTQYELIAEFHSKNGVVVIRRFKFNINLKNKTKLKGKDTDIMKRKTNKSYRALDTNNLVGLEF